MLHAKHITHYLLAIAITATFTACKKEERKPPFSAAMLQSGRAAIKFTASKAFNGDKEFNIINTPITLASNQPLGSTARNVKLEATDVYETGTYSRKAIIDLAINGYGPSTINLVRSNGLPQGNIRLESYSLFGYFRHSQMGTITITKFTPTEIEGSFTATFDDGTIIDNGQFAGRFWNIEQEMVNKEANRQKGK